VRTLTATDSTLVVQAPPAIALGLIGVAIVLTVVALLRRPPRVARLSAFLATLTMLYVGWHAHAKRVTLEPRGFYVDGLYGEEERVGWLGVASIDAGALAGGKGEPGRLLFLLRNSREVSLDLSDLDAAEQAQVVAYARARLKPG
jgi:hypothetical protein